MEAYSLSLLFSLLVSGSALALVAWERWGAKGATRSHRGRVGPTHLASVGVVATLATAALHLVSGHWPGSPEALGAIGFTTAHPALIVAGGFAVLAIFLSPRKKS